MQPGSASDDEVAFAVPDLGELLGGRRGILDASLPGMVLVIVDVFAPLPAAIVASLLATVALALLRLVRGEPVRQAIMSIGGIALAAGLAAFTGDAKTFFLPGILLNIAYATGCALSALLRRPALGFLAGALDKKYAGWRDDARLRRAAAQATWVWAAVFAVRACVQGWLYVDGQVSWLPTARLALGLPLWGLAVTASLLLLEGRDRGDRSECAADV